MLSGTRPFFATEGMSATVRWDGKHYDLKQCGAVLFDLDGTLWDSSEVVVRAWREVLRGQGRDVTPEQLRGVMGLQLPDIGKKLFPEMDPDRVLHTMQECCRLENELIRQVGGRLFPGVEAMLHTLSARMPLAVVSNCQEGYIEAFLAYHKLGGYIRDFQWAGMHGRTKGANIRSVVARCGMRNPCYVGDTAMDAAASAEADIPFIHAAYGFGKVEACAASLARPADLPGLLG